MSIIDSGEERGSWQVLGDATIEVAGELARALKASFVAGAQDIRVDLVHVERIDCAFLQTLMAATREAEQRGGQCWVQHGDASRVLASTMGVTLAEEKANS